MQFTARIYPNRVKGYVYHRITIPPDIFLKSGLKTGDKALFDLIKKVEDDA